MLRKSTLREIKHSLGRYLAILAIVALGVGFFSGLKVSKTALVNTGDQYLKETSFFDYRLLCSLGFTRDDVKAIGADAAVTAAEGAKWEDALIIGKDGSDTAFRIHSLTKKINTPCLTAGRLPETGGECLGDVRFFKEEDLGSTIMLSPENSTETTDAFTVRSFTLVGVASSPCYLNYERGTTQIGSGTLSGYLYVPEEDFTSAYYAEIFVTLGLPGKIYSETYSDALDAAKDKVTALCDARGQTRYNSIMAEADEKIGDARSELADARQKYQDEKKSAEDKLSDARQKLADGQDEIETNRSLLAEKKTALQNGQQQWEEGKAALEAGSAALEEGWAAAAAQFDRKKEELQAAAGVMPPEALQQALDRLAAEKAEAQRQYYEKKYALSQQSKTLEETREKLKAGEAELADGEQKLRDAQAEWDTQAEALRTAEKEAQEKFAEAEKEIDDAQAKIDRAQKDADEIEKPTCYTLSRNTNIGYACFENDSDIVAGIANVFPAFFFLVAALVCMTTMSRMIDEQRTQIGVLKALGYSKAAILSKYMFYSGSAALIGCVAGFLGGSYLFPQVIWKAYNIMYEFASLQFVFDVPLALISVAVSLFCSIGVTWISCGRELSETPAQLCRPKSPKAGKRILLERVPLIWNHLKFLRKVSLRNIFRYKKRLFMMILGIGGCTALLLTGFGIRDSIQDIAVQQYTEIQHYDFEVSFKDPLTEKDLAAFRAECSTAAEEILPVFKGNVDLQKNNTSKSVYMVVPQEPEKLSALVSLHDKKGDLPYPGKGEALINSGLADNFKIRKGDTLTFTDEDMHTFTLRVTGIFDNLVYNYVYLSPETYAEATGAPPEYKTAFIDAPAGADVYQAGALLTGNSLVGNVAVSQDIMDRLGTMMSSLNYIVVFVTFSAAALAFIVLYNLSNINITERTREIATIKVLGFNGKETASYVFRESVLLTLMGALVGVGVGIRLHAFVIEQIKVDLVAFRIRILPGSYLLAIFLTLIFAAIVNFFMYFKTDRINMAESLKSIE